MNLPHRIVILGGGTAGWMAANLMSERWPASKVRITVVESPDIGIIGVGEGSTPTLKRFFETMGIAESEWMPRCKATYKTSISFEGWSPASGIAQYGHPFLTQPDTFTERAFHINCLTRRLGLDVNTAPETFLLNGVLARQYKSPVAPYHFPFKIEYGYHFDSGLLGSFLAEHAGKNAVEHLQRKVVGVEVAETGDIVSLKCEGGEMIEGDFFVDCTGFASVLLQKSLGVEFQSFADNLFNDSAVVFPTEPLDPRPVQTLSKALKNGWCWQIPLTHRTGNGYVYSSAYSSANDAEHELRLQLGLLDEPIEARHLKMRVGQVAKHWSRNCLALGLSQGFIEPLEATALHLVQISIETFIDDYEKGDFQPDHRDEFNAAIRNHFDQVRSYIVAHYKLNTRDDTDYWRDNRANMKLPESLLQLLDVWYRRGDIVEEIRRQKIGDHFGVTSWHCLLAGYGAFPPLAADQPGQGDLYLEQRVEEYLERCSLNFQTQETIPAS